MKKRLIPLIAACVYLLAGLSVSAYDTSEIVIREKHHSFAAQYEYHEGDFDKSFTSYPGIIYTSGIEYADNGTVYECPAIYIDKHAQLVDDYTLKKGEAKFVINNDISPYFDQCVLYNERLLVPIDAFQFVGCEVSFNPDTYVGTIRNNETVLEILPNLIGMRKNQENGFYVPLEVCARFVDDILYVPVRAVADEMGINVNWDSTTNTVSISK